MASEEVGSLLLQKGSKMAANDSDGHGELLVGLPDELVLSTIITRLPWFTRPVCRAVSKAWRSWIDTSANRPEALIRSREHLLPLLQDRFLVCTFDIRTFISKCLHDRPEESRSGYRRLQWRDETYQIGRRWRELPSLQEFFSQPPVSVMLMATAGIVYARAERQSHNFVVKLDMAGGDWTWKRIPLPHCLTSDPVPFNGKVYLPSCSTEGESTAGNEGEMVHVHEHDLTTEQCLPVKRCNRDNLRVVRRKLPEESCGIVEEELYSLVEHEWPGEPKLEILVYDDCKNSWRTREMIPIPECRWSDIEDVKLVNGDCFEPAPDGGINTVCIYYEASILTWFNSSVSKTWVEFIYHIFLEGKCLEYLQVTHGWLYGMFIEDRDSEDEKVEETENSLREDKADQQDPSLRKRTIMKGKISVEQNQVVWEEVLDVGCFQEPYYLEPEVLSLVNVYTLMT